jgi:predicted transcriptional regulator
MTDPRLTVSIVGIGAVYASFKADASTIAYDATQDGGDDKVGLAVTLSAAGTIATAADGEAVIGKLCKVEKDNICTVQIAGGMTLPGGNGASLTVGKKIVGALSATSAEGYIREVATATAAELGLCRGFIYDAGTTTAVEVYL